VTEALKTSNIKTVLFILRTIDKERRLDTNDDDTYILIPMLRIMLSNLQQQAAEQRQRRTSRARTVTVVCDGRTVTAVQ
jgi:hypothetical protein